MCHQPTAHPDYIPSGVTGRVQEPISAVYGWVGHGPPLDESSTSLVSWHNAIQILAMNWEHSVSQHDLPLLHLSFWIEDSCFILWCCGVGTFSSTQCLWASLGIYETDIQTKQMVSDSKRRRNWMKKLLWDSPKEHYLHSQTFISNAVFGITNITMIGWQG